MEIFFLQIVILFLPEINILQKYPPKNVVRNKGIEIILNKLNSLNIYKVFIGNENYKI